MVWDGRMAGSPRRRYDDSTVQAEYLVAERSLAGSQANGYDDNIEWVGQVFAGSLPICSF